MDPALAKEIAMLASARAINDAIDRGGSEIQQFYREATILISGGTGFMGKQLIEKLFRSCDIKKVFLLMRPKKMRTIQERLERLFEDPVFDSVKKMRPGFEKKVCPIVGDVAEPRLGISSDDRATIIAETEIIIHAAATVNFDEPLRVAVNTNVRGTVEMLTLGKQCKKLKSFVHVSTAFAHATRSRFNKAVDEEFYEAALSPQLAIDMVATMDEKRLNDITPELIQNWPNTYTFTKAIGEEAVRQVSSELPISIVRPAIVIASLQEPAPGWLDISCAFGPSGFILGAGLGLVHTLLACPDIKIDLVPVDLVNNAIILAGWATAKRLEEGEYKPKIYTVTSMRNHIYFNDVVSNIETLTEYSSPRQVYYIFHQQTQYRLVYFFLSWLWHYIPGYMLDLVMMMMGKKPMAVKLYTKADKHANVLSYFTTHEWGFTDKNLVAMFSSLNPTDRKIYNCDVATVNWKDLMVSWTLGIRRYIVKDGLQGTAHGVRKQFWFRILHYTVVAPLYFYLLYKFATLVFAVLYLVTSIVFNGCMHFVK